MSRNIPIKTLSAIHNFLPTYTAILPIMQHRRWLPAIFHIVAQLGKSGNNVVGSLTGRVETAFPAAGSGGIVVACHSDPTIEWSISPSGQYKLAAPLRLGLDG